MDALSFRATVFVRTDGASAGRTEMIERYFQRREDAVTWCQVMAQALDGACGSWIIARSLGGRSMELVDACYLLTGLVPGPMIDEMGVGVLGRMGVDSPGMTTEQRAIPLLASA